MNTNPVHPDDDFGPDPIDRGSGKQMGPGRGGGSHLDPSYEDALRILGREYKIPRPFQQQALIMDDEEAAVLSRQLTELRRAGAGGYPILGEATPVHPSETSSGGETAELFIAALQENPPDREKLARLHRILESAGEQTQQSLALVCEHPIISARLGLDNPDK